MSHQVLSRKYRPHSFEELVGQEHVARILRNAITADRVGHAYLFVGPRGVGKTTTARIFAKALNCQSSEVATIEPCGTCTSCKDITSGVDLDVVEMDAASNNHVEDVRRLREQVGYATVRSRYRIWIVDEVHMLSTPAFNAFLKTLEEPPEGVKFVFCTTEEHKLPETFRSRCQRVEFRPIEDGAIAGRLEGLATKEGVEVEDGLLEAVAAAALGGLRDAESLLEQLIAASDGAVLSRDDLDALAGRAPRERLAGLLEAVQGGDAAASLDALDLCLESGSKPGVLLEQWMEALRMGLVDAARKAEHGGVAKGARALDVLLEKRMHLRSGASGPLVLQVAAVELARLPDARDLDRLIASLEKGLAAEPAAPVPPPAPHPAERAPAPQPAETARAASTPAPAPAAQREASPRSRTGRPTLEQVQARWTALVEAGRQRDARFGEALGRARPLAWEDERLVIGIRGDDPLARSALDRREAILTFREIAEAVFGVVFAPRVEIEAVTEAPSRNETRPHELDAIRRVTEATGGRLVNVEKPLAEDASADSESGA